MADITIKMKDGRTLDFPSHPRPGGSYTQRLKFEGAFAVIEDEWGKRTAIPAGDIAEAMEKPNRY